MPSRHNRRAFIASRSAYPAAPWHDWQAERLARSRRNGIALLGAVALGFAALFGYAAEHDSRIARERAEAASHSGEAAGQRKPARIEGVDGSAEIMGAIAGELRAAGCQVRVDSPSSYEVESC